MRWLAGVMVWLTLLLFIGVFAFCKCSYCDTCHSLCTVHFDCMKFLSAQLKVTDSRLHYTVMCRSVGTPKSNNFPFVPNVKVIIFRCPKIWAHFSLIVMCSNIGTPKNH